MGECQSANGLSNDIDLLTIPLVAVTVLTVTLAAAYAPARRASRINPTESLRDEWRGVVSAPAEPPARD